MIDVSGAFNGLLQTISLTRKNAGSRDANGRWIDGADVVTSIQAVVQTATSDDLLVLPEGERTQETIKIHTTSLLRTASESGTYTADEITYQGNVYKVIQAFDRKTIGNYYKALAAREA